MPAKIEVRKANHGDLEAIKEIADSERDSIGFVTRATFRDAIEQDRVMVATVEGTVVGFQHYYHRKRDLQTTLYQKVVLNEFRRRGLGTMLVDAVIKESRSISREKLRLKCPAELPSNAFHEQYGFILVDQEKGKHRKLNIWEYLL